MRNGVTLLLPYEEHCDKAAAEGLAHKSYTTFCRSYAEYVVAKSVTNHLEHKLGQVMEVEWASLYDKYGSSFYDSLSPLVSKVYDDCQFWKDQTETVLAALR